MDQNHDAAVATSHVPVAPLPYRPQSSPARSDKSTMNLYTNRHSHERPRQFRSRSQSRSPSAHSACASTCPAMTSASATLVAIARTTATQHHSRSRSASPDLAPPCAPRDPHRNPRAVDAAARMLGLPGGFEAMRGTNCSPQKFRPAEFASRPEDCLEAISARRDEAERQWELLRRARTTVCSVSVYVFSNLVCPRLLLFRSLGLMSRFQSLLEFVFYYCCQIQFSSGASVAATGEWQIGNDAIADGSATKNMLKNALP